MGGAAGRGDIGSVAPEFLEIATGAEQEHAAVPEIVAAGDELARAGLVGLLDELGDAMHGPRAGGPADVAVAGFRLARHDAEGDELALHGRGQGLQDDPLERGLVADHVVGGQHQQHRVGALPGCTQSCVGGKGDRRSGVPAHRLEHDGGRRDAPLPELLGDHEAVGLVAHHDRR